MAKGEVKVVSLFLMILVAGGILIGIGAWVFSGGTQLQITGDQDTTPPVGIQLTTKTIQVRSIDIYNTTDDPSYFDGTLTGGWSNGIAPNVAVKTTSGTDFTGASTGTYATALSSTSDVRSSGKLWVTPSFANSACFAEVSYGFPEAEESIDIPLRTFQAGQVRIISDTGSVISGFSDSNLTTGGAIAVGTGGTTRQLTFDIDGTNTTDAIYGCAGPGEGLALIVRFNSTEFDKTTTGFVGGTTYSPSSEEGTYLQSTFGNVSYEFKIYLIPAVKSNTLVGKTLAKAPELDRLGSSQKINYIANGRSGVNPAQGTGALFVSIIPVSTYYSTVTGTFKTGFATDDTTPVRVIAHTWTKQIEVS